MPLSPPEPLPFDYVDELIDQTVVFAPEELSWGGDPDLSYFSARPAGAVAPSNWSRLMASVVTDGGQSDEFYRYDDEGFIISWNGGEPCRLSSPPSEAELDDYVQYGIISDPDEDFEF